MPGTKLSSKKYRKTKWPTGLAGIAKRIAVDQRGRLWASVEPYCGVLLASGDLPAVATEEWRYRFGDGAYVRCIEK